MLVAVTGCATAPVDPAQETLDERDGTTITRLAEPLGFVAEKVRTAGTDPFALLAPFETNRMGLRRLYLWIAVPVESKADVTVAVMHDDTLLLQANTPLEPEQGAAVRPPYPTTAPWQRQFVSELTDAQLAALTQAEKLTIELRYDDGHSERFAVEAPARSVLEQFRSRLGL